MSGVDIHKQLASRNLKRGKNLQEYYLDMKELASQRRVDTESVIQLSTVSRIAAAKWYYMELEIIVSSELVSIRTRKCRNEVRVAEVILRGEQRRTSKLMDRCYNCRESRHKANMCRFKNKDKKCFKCNGFGHELFR